MIRDNVDLARFLTGAAVTRARFVRGAGKQLSANDGFVRTVRRRAAKVREFDGHEAIASWLAPLRETRRAVFFIAPHFGNYVGSFIEIACSFPHPTDFVTLRGMPWDEHEDAFWDAVRANIPHTLTVYRVGSHRSHRDLFRLLTGGASCFVLFDLFEDFGPTAACDVFGVPLRMTFGWSRFAHRADALVAFVHPSHLDRPEPRVGTLIDPRRYQSVPEFEVAVRRAAATELERLLMEAPHAWFMWEHWRRYVGGRDGDRA